jgi:hypothetical protein
MTTRGQRSRSGREIVVSLGTAMVLLLAAAHGWAGEVHWGSIKGAPQLVFGVQSSGLVSAPMVVVSLVDHEGRTIDFFLALPETVAAEVSRHIVRQTFDPQMVDDARMRALAALGALKPEDVGTMLAPLRQHNNLQTYLRNLKFALARVVREASRPSGQEVEAFFRVNGSGLRLLTGLRIGKREFEFSPRGPEAHLFTSLLARTG